MASVGGDRLVETKSVIGDHQAMARATPRPHPCGCGRVRAAPGRGSRATATREFMRRPRDSKTLVRTSSSSSTVGANVDRHGCDSLCSPSRSGPVVHVGVGAHDRICRCKNQQQGHDENNRSRSSSCTRRASCSTQRADCGACDCQLDSMVRDTPAQGLVATLKRLSGHSALQPTAQHSPDTDAGPKQAPPPPSLSPHHHSDHTAQGNPCKSTTTPGPTTAATSKHARILSSSTQQPTQTPPAALENRQIPPPSPSPSTAAGTYIQDPSLGILLPGTITPTATPSNTSSNASISTAVIVTIVLGTIAGVVTVSLVVILINMQLRRRRRRGGQPCSPTESDKKGLSANASSTVLNSPGLASPFPKMTTSTPPMAPGTEIPAKGGNDVRLDELRPPPRLGERRFHQITRSEGSIEVRPSRSLHHTRWGKPSSLGNIPSAKDMPSYYVGDGQTHDHASPDSRAPGRSRQYNLFPTRTTPPAIKTHKPAASTSTTSTLQGTGVTPPRTPKSGVLSPVNGLVSPGPPPTRALPSPPLKYWQVNPLSPPLDSQMDHVRPEEIGVAIGSPTTEERREKRPRLDESDMERLGGTYSPFRR